MSRSLIKYLGRWVGVWGAAAVMLLAGCTTPTVSARVTSFQQWPAGVDGQTYRFVPADPAQVNNLEYQSFKDMVRAGIGATGLIEARGNEKARFDVAFRYGELQTQVMERRPYDPFFAGGFYGPRPWGMGGGFWGPTWVDVPVVAFRNNLSLQIFDAERGGAEVYRSSAFIVTERENLLHTMPFLVHAIFDNFPGNNGAEREVRMPLSR